MRHYEKYEILMDNKANVEKKLNDLNKEYETTICGTTYSDRNGIILIVGLYGKHKV